MKRLKDIKVNAPLAAIIGVMAVVNAAEFTADCIEYDIEHPVVWGIADGIIMGAAYTIAAKCVQHVFFQEKEKTTSE